MKGALGTTFGVLVYQEQVMQISRDVCGFTGGEADTLRKAIGKKKAALFIQLDRRIQMMLDLQIASRIPLINPK